MQIKLNKVIRLNIQVVVNKFNSIVKRAEIKNNNISTQNSNHHTNNKNDDNN